MSGWVKLHRSLVNWEWYGNINVWRVFSHLILTANYEEQRWQGLVIQRGQRVVSLPNLAVEIGLTVKQVRGALDKLKRTGELEIKGRALFSLITVVNYNKYQGDEDMEGQTKDTPEGRQKADEGQDEGTQPGRQRATIKESKNQELKNLSLNSSADEKKYKFKGVVIRLTAADYQKWEEAYPNLNLYAELVSRDEWLATQPVDIQKKWFPSTAQYLGNRNKKSPPPTDNAIAPENAVFAAYERLGIKYNKPQGE